MKDIPFIYSEIKLDVITCLITASYELESASVSKRHEKWGYKTVRTYQRSEHNKLTSGSSYRKWKLSKWRISHKTTNNKQSNNAKQNRRSTANSAQAEKFRSCMQTSNKIEKLIQIYSCGWHIFAEKNFVISIWRLMKLCRLSN